MRKIVIVFMFFSCLGLSNVIQAKPLIGIMLNTGSEGGYSIYPWYAIRQNYGQVIAQMGGIPVFIGHDQNLIDDYIHLLDGLVLTGGDVATPDEAFTTGLSGAVDPKRYPRSYLEFQLVKQAYAKNMPLLGICAGMQNMNVAMGGTLYRNLKEELKTPIQHRNEIRDKTHHEIEIYPGTLLFNIFHTTTLQVNSNHNAGIKKVASGFNVSARAPDGVIEGMEASNKRFFMGVMWHPEFLITPQETKLWQAFIKQATLYQQERNAKRLSWQDSPKVTSHNISREVILTA